MSAVTKLAPVNLATGGSTTATVSPHTAFVALRSCRQADVVGRRHTYRTRTSAREPRPRHHVKINAKLFDVRRISEQGVPSQSTHHRSREPQPIPHDTFRGIDPVRQIQTSDGRAHCRRRIRPNGIRRMHARRHGCADNNHGRGDRVRITSGPSQLPTPLGQAPQDTTLEMVEPRRRPLADPPTMTATPLPPPPVSPARHHSSPLPIAANVSHWCPPGVGSPRQDAVTSAV